MAIRSKTTLANKRNRIFHNSREAMPGRIAGQPTRAKIERGAFLLPKLHIEEAIIHANRQRRKSNTEIAREFRELKRIEEGLAKERLKTSTGGKKGLTLENLPESGKGNARDKAAAQVGVSGRQGEKMAQVADAIDGLREQGKDSEADELETTLDRNDDILKHYGKEPENPGNKIEKDIHGAPPLWVTFAYSTRFRQKTPHWLRLRCGGG